VIAGDHILIFILRALLINLILLYGYETHLHPTKTTVLKQVFETSYQLSIHALSKDELANSLTRKLIAPPFGIFCLLLALFPHRNQALFFLCFRRIAGGMDAGVPLKQDC
jgi:hydrogenase-4 membrane subunit HyfE